MLSDHFRVSGRNFPSEYKDYRRNRTPWDARPRVSEMVVQDSIARHIGGFTVGKAPFDIWDDTGVDGLKIPWNRVGWPDLMGIVLLNGSIKLPWAFEVKPGPWAKPTNAQVQLLGRLETAGVITGVVWSKEDAVAAVSHGIYRLCQARGIETVTSIQFPNRSLAA